MKIAIFFLILGVSCFIEPISCDLKKLTKAQAKCHANLFYQIAREHQGYKNCPEGEKILRATLILQKITYWATSLADDIACTVDEVLATLGLTLSQISLIKAGNITELLNGLNLDELVGSVGSLLQGVLALVGVVLIDLLQEISGLTNTLLDLKSLGLLNTVQDILNKALGTAAGNLLGITSGLLSSLGIGLNLFG